MDLEKASQIMTSRLFFKKEIRDGATTNFWFNNWLEMGGPIDIACSHGTHILGIHRSVKFLHVRNPHG